MKKYILFAIAIAIVGLMITSAASVPMKISTNSVTMDKPMNVEKNRPNVVKLGSSAQYLSMQSVEAVEPDFVNRLPVLGTWPVFAFPGNQWHPGFGRTDGGVQVAAFFDEDYDEILYTYSTDDGQTFNDEMVYWSGYGGDYPSIKHWDGVRLFGTYVSDYLENGGGDTHNFECTDATDYETYVMWTVPFSTLGFSDMMDADIACDSSQNTWEWGVSSYVMSTTHAAGPMTDGPVVIFANPDDETKVYISWYQIDNCAHCDVDIDRPNIMSYSVYDLDELGDDSWTLLCRKMDFDDVTGGFDTMYDITGDGNLEYPAVAANDDNIVILAETDENGNKDIICYYTDDGNIENLQTSFVVDTDDDERYPDVRNVNDDDFICTYVKNDNLYALKTEDGGQTWIETRWQINENDDCVVEEYKTSDLCEKALFAMWEEDCGEDVDIYMGNVLPNDPPGAPVITGETNGNTGTSYEYGFTSIDPDGDDIAEYTVDWGDETGEEIITGPFASGAEATASHTWAEDGDYTITAKAKDVNGLVGPEGTLVVTMPVNLNQQSQQHSVVMSFVQMLQNLFGH